MSTAKQEIESLLKTLPENCTLEDVQYHLYVIEKVQRGLEAADRQGAISHKDAAERLGKWTTK